MTCYTPDYGAFDSQLMNYARACSVYEDFFTRFVAIGWIVALRSVDPYVRERKKTKHGYR